MVQSYQENILLSKAGYFECKELRLSKNKSNFQQQPESSCEDRKLC